MHNSTSHYLEEWAMPLRRSLRADLVAAVTRYDRTRQRRRDYDPGALARYVQRCEQVAATVEAGGDLTHALNAAFDGRLRDRVALYLRDLGYRVDVRVGTLSELRVDQVPARFPRLIRACMWVACLSETEAASAIWCHLHGLSYAGEAVNHFGGVEKLLRRAWETRHASRAAARRRAAKAA
jgi:hypothetical protein